MPSATTGFVPSQHGFPFPNSYPPGTPVIEVPTPLGILPIGDASYGVCGGMVFAAVDLFLFGQPRPIEPGPPVFRYLCKRLIDSWNMPFGVLKYYDWQRRPAASKTFAGVRFADGLLRLTIMEEWPKIRRSIDAGLPAALGIVKSSSFSPMALNKNHQVLAHSYELAGDESTVTLHVYDPNYPNDDTAAITFGLLDPDADTPILHSCEGATVRGLFLTEYSRPVESPLF